jgi:hypothetical protein
MSDPSEVLAATAMTGNPYLAMGDMALKSAQGGAAGPSSARNDSNTDTKASSMFDSSGWNVSFGSGDISATTEKTISDAGVGQSAVGNYAPYLMMLIGAVVLWKMVKKS